MKVLKALFVAAFLRGSFAMAGAEQVTVQITDGVSGLDYFGYPTNAAMAAEKGRADARRDVSNGILRLPMYGLPAESAPGYNRILKERYNVHQYELAGCIVSEGLVSYANGYTEVSLNAIKARFGTNVFNDVYKEAKRPFKKGLDAEIPVIGRALQTHRVKPGETLTSIAKQHQVSLQALTDANPRVAPTQLQINQILLLPHGPNGNPNSYE